MPGYGYPANHCGGVRRRVLAQRIACWVNRKQVESDDQKILFWEWLVKEEICLLQWFPFSGLWAHYITKFGIKQHDYKVLVFNEGLERNGYNPFWEMRQKKSPIHSKVHLLLLRQEIP